jgi:CubicO group peptidase (beta-lactamase class C family)
MVEPNKCDELIRDLKAYGRLLRGHNHESEEKQINWRRKMKKKQFIEIASLFVVFLLALACRGTSPPLSSKIDKLVNDYVVNHQFMGSVLVAEKGKVVFAKGYGLANVEQNIPNTPETKFMIGSITKQFTAMLVTQLAEKKFLSLDNKISDILPEFPRDIGEKITIEMLLCHTSGLILPEGIEKYYYASRKEDFLKEYLKQLSEEGLRFEPGKGYGYSNAGYFILGLIIEKVTGKSYEAVLAEQILKPLGMTQTGCDRKGLVVENRATSYQKLRDRYITWNEETNSYDPAVCPFGCGNLYSTVEDLFKFSKALATNRLLSKKYMDMYLKMRIVRTRPTIPHISQELVRVFFGTYGNGFVGEISIIEDPDTKEKETLYWHDGTYKLFRSNHFHYSGKDQVIIICSNCSFLIEGNEMVLKIHQLLNNKPYDHILIKNSLTQYLEEDVAMHAGIPAAVDEYFRFKNDTVHFIVPEKEYFVAVGRQVAERGDWDDAIAIFQTVIPEFPGFWEAYDALGDIYIMKGDKELAIQSFKKSLELNPQNPYAMEMLKTLGNK